MPYPVISLTVIDTPTWRSQRQIYNKILRVPKDPGHLFYLAGSERLTASKQRYIKKKLFLLARKDDTMPFQFAWWTHPKGYETGILGSWVPKTLPPDATEGEREHLRVIRMLYERNELNRQVGRN